VVLRSNRQTVWRPCGRATVRRFQRDSNNNEIDCLREYGDKLDLIEIKSGKTITKDYQKGIVAFNKTTATEVKSASVVYGGDMAQKRNDIQYIPWIQARQLV